MVRYLPTAQSIKGLVAQTRPLGLLVALAITGLVFAGQEYLQQPDRFGYAGVFMLSLIGNASLVLPLPTFMAAFAGGSVLDPLAVGVIAAAGATIGELTGYLAGSSGRVTIEKRETYRRVHEWMRRRGLRTLFVLAAIPNPLFDIAGMTAGVLRFPVPAFLLATWAGKTVKFLAIAFLGAGAMSLVG